MELRIAVQQAAAVAAGTLVLVVGGCGHAGGPPSRTNAPVVIDMVRGVSWDYPNEGYDPTLPGFRLAGGIGTVGLTGSAVPEEFVLEIRTTIAHRPNLEGFAVGWADSLMQITPFVDGSVAEISIRPEDDAGQGNRSSVEQTYFVFSRTAEVVRIRFLPPALRLIARGCTVSWVDWYRR